MHKYKKISVLSVITLCSLFVGCSKSDYNNKINFGVTSKLKEVPNFSDEFPDEHTVDEDIEQSLTTDSPAKDNKNKNDNVNSSNNYSAAPNINNKDKETNSSSGNANNDNSNKSNVESSTNSTPENNNESNSAKSELDDVVLVSNPIFVKSEITDSIKARMEGKSMKENTDISYEDLSYLTITYLDYNGNTKQGEMVVHKKLADEVLAIFKDIYNAKFPIEKMNLVDNYNANDHSSMVANNSSAFCYRTIAGTNKVSKHGMGVAIDINPFYNPHVLKSSGKVNPSEASKYANRSLNAKGMIKKNDAVYRAFTSRGWTWGGNWNNPDYQHFEKSI